MVAWQLGVMVTRGRRYSHPADLSQGMMGRKCGASMKKGKGWSLWFKLSEKLVKDSEDDPMVVPRTNVIQEMGFFIPNSNTVLAPKVACLKRFFKPRYTC